MEAIEQQDGADTARAGNITTSNEVWRYIFDAIDEPVFLHDAQCCVLLANRAYCHEAGVTEAQALGKPYWEVFPRGNGPLPGCKDAMDGKNHDCSQEEVRVGAKLYLSKSYAVRDEQGKLRHALHKLNDITERRQAQEVLRLSALKHWLLFESSPYAQMTLAPPSWKFTEANQATVQLFGASSVAQFTALGLWDVSPQRQPDGRPSREKAQEVVATAMRDGSLFFEWEHQRLDGQPFASDVLLTRIEVAEEVFLQATVRDISEYKRLENELKRDAYIDMLTGLNNRRNFFELAEQEMARAKRYGSPLTALMLDLDHFKLVNDTYGHQVGDMVLQKFSEVCVKTLRGIDILGRIGGEEFAVLMPETKSEQALEVAERLRLAIASAAVTLPHDDAVHFTVSIGAVSLLTTDSKVDDLLKRADAVLYTAKGTGRNRVCWDATADPFPQLGNMEEANHLPKSHWTVLNVENQEGNVLLVEALVAQRSDLRLLTARTGNEGCEMARSFRPGTILMDIRLPDISGFEALKILQANPATAHIPVIAVSSDSYQYQIDKGLKAGFFRYLTKPYRLDDLMKAIDDALRHAAESQSSPPPQSL